MKKARWFTFEIATDADLRDALDWLGRGYDAAGKRKKLSCAASLDPNKV